MHRYQQSAKDYQPPRRGGRVVYRGGLENRFGLRPTGVRIPPSPPAFMGKMKRLWEKLIFERIL
jgi:hypothetical protein